MEDLWKSAGSAIHLQKNIRNAKLETAHTHIALSATQNKSKEKPARWKRMLSRISQEKGESIRSLAERVEEHMTDCESFS